MRADLFDINSYAVTGSALVLNEVTILIMDHVRGRWSQNLGRQNTDFFANFIVIFLSSYVGYAELQILFHNKIHTKINFGALLNIQQKR